MACDLLYGWWKLVRSPFTCQQQILEEAKLHFGKNNRLVATDTCNDTFGHYEVEFNTDVSGIITMSHNGWTQSGRRWRSHEETLEANRINQLMQALLKQSIPFTLRDHQLCLTHDGQEYVFSHCSNT